MGVMSAMMEKASYNVGTRRQKLCSVVLGAKLRRMNLKGQRDRNGWSQGAPQRKLIYLFIVFKEAF